MESQVTFGILEYYGGKVTDIFAVVVINYVFQGVYANELSMDRYKVIVYIAVVLIYKDEEETSGYLKEKSK